MGERLEHVTLEKLSPEELRSRHLDTLRFLLSLSSEDENRLSLDSLQGRAVDISNKNDVGLEALEELGVEEITEICLPTTRFYYLEEEIQENKRRLVRRLGFIPDNTIRLVTIFDHSDHFISTQAAHEIKRILVPGGQYLVTCRDLTKVPRNDEDLPELDKETGTIARALTLQAYLHNLPDLPNLWHQMGDSYAPNKFAAIYTKPGRV